MTKLKRATYSAAIKLETAQLVVDQGYTQEEAAKAMGLGKSTVSKWVTQLKQERNGQSPAASPMTPEQIEIRELKKEILLPASIKNWGITDASLMTRMKELEDENRRLKKMYAEERLKSEV
ncbi:transposase, partial [Pseudoalteromonas nigrifaciens]|uniref:transposase n=1 Tax=Pseudoalteromonas nigrifaciens TaxID=28109 RepID=UPI003D02F437